MNGIWFGYLAVAILLVVSLVLDYLDRKARRHGRHAHH